MVGMTSHHPIFFCRPGVKIKRVIVILRLGVKIMLWGVKNLKKKLTCNLKTIAFREFCLNTLFSYFWVSFNIVKLQTYSSLHISGVIAC